MTPETFWGWLAFLTALGVITCGLCVLIGWWADDTVDTALARAWAEPWEEDEYP